MNPFLADLDDQPYRKVTVAKVLQLRCLRLRVAVFKGPRHFLYFKLPSVPTFQTLTYYLPKISTLIRIFAFFLLLERKTQLLANKNMRSRKASSSSAHCQQESAA